MNKKKLTTEGDFVVGEEKTLNYIIGGIFFLLFLYGVYDVVRRNFESIDYQSLFFALGLIGALYCFRRAHSNRIYIRINRNGIYQDEKLVTDWFHFLNAYIEHDDQKRIYDLSDRFVLIVEYRKQGEVKGFRRKIALGNTQNKSEEDVLAAVRFFWKESQYAKQIN